MPEPFLIFNLTLFLLFLSDNHFFFFGIHRHSEMAQCGALLRQMLDSDAGPSGPDGEL
jgi:hypothetical protein